MYNGPTGNIRRARYVLLQEQTVLCRYLVVSVPPPNAAWAAASRAIGTRNGEQET